MTAKDQLIIENVISALNEKGGVEIQSRHFNADGSIHLVFFRVKNLEEKRMVEKAAQNLFVFGVGLPLVAYAGGYYAWNFND